MNGADSSEKLSVEFTEKGKSPEIVENGNVVSFAAFPALKFPSGAANGVFPGKPQAFNRRVGGGNSGGIEKGEHRAGKSFGGVKPKVSVNDGLHAAEGLIVGKVVEEAQRAFLGGKVFFGRHEFAFAPSIAKAFEARGIRRRVLAFG